MVTINDLQPVRKYAVSPGLEAIDIEGPTPLAGTVCKIDLALNEFRVFAFSDLISKSLYPSVGCFTEISVNLGASVRDFINGKRHECTGHPTYRDWNPPYAELYERCAVASNTIQTNFIRPNGFVIVDGKVIAKPLYAPGRDDPLYAVLGVAGDYTCLEVSGGKARVIELSVWDSQGSISQPRLDRGTHGIATPPLVRKGKITRLTRLDPPFRGANGRLNGDAVDWPPLPEDVRRGDRGPTITSFSAFGVDSTGSHLIMASMFDGELNVHTSTDKGVLCSVMAELLIQHGAYNAVLGGGGGDTQQYVKGRSNWPSNWTDSELVRATELGLSPEFRNAPVRPKPDSQDRGEVEGVRGLGAIGAVIPRKQRISSA